MKIAVIGSRDFIDYHFLKRALDRFRVNVSQIDTIISGGARGADRLAERYARNHNIPATVLKADWNRYGKRAGMIRNGEVIRACDLVIAFWDGISPGTGDAINKAQNAGKTVHVCRKRH